MADKTFAEVFEGNMRLLHLPLPTAKSWYESLEAALGMTAALSGLVKLGDKPIGRLFLQAGMGGAAAGGAAAATDAIAVSGAMLGSLYVGLVVGCIVDAAVETVGASALVAVGRLLTGLRDSVPRRLHRWFLTARDPLAAALGRRIADVLRVHGF
jgi:hypothetical protein